MKILWVKAGGLVPLDTGGKIRSYHILKELARQHDVTLFTFYAAHPHDSHDELRRVLSRVECYPLAIPAPGSTGDLINYARHVFSSYPYSMAKFYGPGVAEALWKLIHTERHNVIVCDFIVAAGVIPWEFPCPKVLFSHNVEAIIWQRHFRVARNPLWKAICWREYRTMARAERTFLQRADHILTVSATDRDFFARFIDPCKITAIPTGVDADYFQPDGTAEKENMLVFTGSMDWLPNEDAVFYFADEILPRIRDQIPAVRLWVVGRRPSQRLQTLATQNKGIEITGTVEDIRPYLRQASVCVVPLRVGSGTRLKIFEAMAMGKAVVATSVGAEGLPVQSGKNIILADRPEEFAQSAIRLLMDREARRRMGREARQLVEQKYSWASAANCFDSVLQTMARPGTRR